MSTLILPGLNTCLYLFNSQKTKKQIKKCYGINVDINQEEKRISTIGKTMASTAHNKVFITPSQRAFEDQNEVVND